MLSVLPAARAELLQRQPIWIVALVLFRVVIALLTLGTRQGNKYAIGFLGHCSPPILLQSLAAGAHGGDRTHDLTLTKGVLYH